MASVQKSLFTTLVVLHEVGNRKSQTQGTSDAPCEIRRIYEIREGDLLKIEAEGESIVLKPQKLPEPGRPVGQKTRMELLNELKKLRKTWR